jgi:hypothetical protein
MQLFSFFILQFADLHLLVAHDLLAFHHPQSFSPMQAGLLPLMIF